MDFSKIIPLQAPWWAPNGHLQTVLGHWLPSELLKDAGTPTRVTLPDGDQLAARCYRGESPLAFALFHGLAGSADSPYMRRLCGELVRRGHSVMAVNHRNCGAGFGLSAKPYHSGRGDDIAHCVDTLRRMFPRKKVVAIGFSLGANALLYLLTQMKHLSQPDFAIAVNPPAHLAKTVRLIQQRGWNVIYHRRFVNDLVALVRRLEAQRKMTASPQISYWMTLEQFDEFYTAPGSGFHSAQHYYETCSTLQHLDNIATPTVILMSKDDPFICATDFKAVKMPYCAALHLVENGGHMGYLHHEPTPLGHIRWMDYAILEYVNRLTE